jgi:hypothetical protein
MRALLVTAAALFATTAFADDAQIAKDMLIKAHAAIKADREVALLQMQKGENGFRVGDIYPYCQRLTDGKGIVGPVAVLAGTDIRTLKDPTGRDFGAEMFKAQQKPEGEITEVNGYLFPKPGTTAPAVPKNAFVMKVAPDLGCGVGYYSTPASTHVSMTVKNFKYSVGQNVEVGDVPNHFMRLFEVHGSVPGAMINGVKITEVSTRGVAELMNGRGGSPAAYVTFAAENGDKFFARNIVSVQPSGNKMRSTWSGTVIGGTGKFANLQGTMPMVNDFDPIANVVEDAQIDIDAADVVASK